MKLLVLIMSLKIKVIVLAILAYYLGNFLDKNFSNEYNLWIKLSFLIWFLITIVIYYQIYKIIKKS